GEGSRVTSLLFREEVVLQRTVLQRAEALRDARGVQFRTGRTRVRVVGGGEVLALDVGRSQLRVLAHHDLVEVQKLGFLGLGDLFGPGHVVTFRDVALLNGFLRAVWDRGNDDGRHLLFAGVGDVLAHVPAVGVDDFLLLGDGVVDLLRLLAGAANAPTRAGRVVERT